MNILRAFEEGHEAWIDLRLGVNNDEEEDEQQSVSSIDCSSIWSDDYRNDTSRSSEEEEDDEEESLLLRHFIHNFAHNMVDDDDDTTCKPPAPMSHNESYTSLRSRWNDTLDGSSDPVLINEQWSVKALSSPLSSQVRVLPTTTDHMHSPKSPRRERMMLMNQQAPATTAAAANVAPVMDVSPEQPSRQMTASTLSLLSLLKQEEEGLDFDDDEEQEEEMELKIVGGEGGRGEQRQLPKREGHRLLLVKKDSCPSLVTRTVSSKGAADHTRRRRRHSDGSLTVAECLTEVKKFDSFPTLVVRPRPSNATTRISDLTTAVGTTVPTCLATKANKKVDSCPTLVRSRPSDTTSKVGDLTAADTLTTTRNEEQIIHEQPQRSLPEVRIVDNRGRRPRRHSDGINSSNKVAGSSCLTKAKKVDSCPTLVRPRPSDATSRASDDTDATPAAAIRNEQDWHCRGTIRGDVRRLPRRHRRHSDSTTNSNKNLGGSKGNKKVDSCPTLVFPKISNHDDNSNRWNYGYIKDDSFLEPTNGRFPKNPPPKQKTTMDYCPFLVQRTKSGIDESLRSLCQSSNSQIRKADSCPTLVRPTRRSGAAAATERQLEEPRQRRPPRRYGGRRMNADTSRRSTNPHRPTLAGLIPPLIRCNTTVTETTTTKNRQESYLPGLNPPLRRSKTVVDTCPSSVRRSISGDSQLSCDLGGASDHHSAGIGKLSPRKDFQLTKTALAGFDFTTAAIDAIASNGVTTTTNLPQDEKTTTTAAESTRRRGRRRIKSNPEILLSEDNDTGGDDQGGLDRFIMASERLGEIIRNRRGNDKSRSGQDLKLLTSGGTGPTRGRGGTIQDAEKKNLFESFTEDTYSILRNQHGGLLSPNSNAMSNTAA